MSISHALVVDDSKSARFSVKKLLQKLNVSVDFAESGEEALKYLESTQPDVIFMDHLMPGMDGFESTKKIKANDEWQEIPVVMCTSKEGDEYLQTAKSLGAVGILPKPATLEQVARILGEITGETIEVPKAQPAPAETVSATAGVITPGTRAQIEGIAQTAVNNLINANLPRMMNEHMQPLREEIKAICKREAEEAAVEWLETAKKQIHDALLAKTKTYINEVSQEVSQKIATDLFDSRFTELNKQVMEKVEGSITDLKEQIPTSNKLPDEVMDEVKNVARFVAAHKAGEAAEQMGRSAAQQVAEQAANEAAEKLVNQALSKYSETVSSQLNKPFYLAIFAVVTSLAALLASFLM